MTIDDLLLCIALSHSVVELASKDGFIFTSFFSLATFYTSVSLGWTPSRLMS